MTQAHEGGCLCGQVRFRATGEPKNVMICHCRLCQKAFGAPFNARALFPREAVEVEGELQRFASSERLWRVSCPACGTRVFTERQDGSFAGLPLANFDDRNAFTPTAHFFTSEKVDWLSFDDGLPQYEGWPPQ